MLTVAPDALLAQSGASIGEVLTESRVQNLPVVGNNVLDLVGSCRVSGKARLARPSTRLQVRQQTPSTQFETVISVSDGRFNNGLFSTTTINPDLVGEIRLILTPVDAEMGRGNGQVQITTRSGTNRYTGSAVWNFRNSAFDPNTWANNRQGRSGDGKAVQPDWTNDHEYTISFGGPIIRNKTFFLCVVGPANSQGAPGRYGNGADGCSAPWHFPFL
jgi:hypothetical protein